MGQKEAAVSVFAQTLALTNGSPQLLNIAGVMMFANKRCAEAKQFFDRAATSATDDALLKRIKQNQASVQKIIK